MWAVDRPWGPLVSFLLRGVGREPGSLLSVALFPRLPSAPSQGLGETAPAPGRPLTSLVPASGPSLPPALLPRGCCHPSLCQAHGHDGGEVTACGRQSGWVSSQSRAAQSSPRKSLFTISLCLSQHVEGSQLTQLPHILSKTFLETAFREQ